MNPIEVAIEAAQKASTIIQSYADKGFEIQKKAKNDLVTEADLKSEERIISTIKSYFPDHEILAEESTGAKDLTEQPTWIIDPIDGTTNFAHGFPFYCVSIGFWVGRRPRAAVVLEVPHQELFTAEIGKGAFLNGKSIHVSKNEDPANVLLGTGFPYKDLHLVDDYLQLFKHFMDQTHGVRRPGSAAFDLCCLAAGRIDGFYEYGLSPWDVGAASLIIEEAGGYITDWKGGEDWLFGQRIIASNGLIHDYLLHSIQHYMKASDL